MKAFLKSKIFFQFSLHEKGILKTVVAIFCQTINVNTKHTRQVHIPRYHSISVVASLGTKGPSKFNDSKIFLLYDCSNETQESC